MNVLKTIRFTPLAQLLVQQLLAAAGRACAGARSTVPWIDSLQIPLPVSAPAGEPCSRGWQLHARQPLEGLSFLPQLQDADVPISRPAQAKGVYPLASCRCSPRNCKSCAKSALVGAYRTSKRLAPLMSAKGQKVTLHSNWHMSALHLNRTSQGFMGTHPKIRRAVRGW